MCLSHSWTDCYSGEREEGWRHPHCTLRTPSPPLTNAALIFLSCQHDLKLMMHKCAEKRKNSRQADNSLWLIVSLTQLTKLITELLHHHLSTIQLLLWERCLPQMFLLTHKSVWWCACVTSLWTRAGQRTLSFPDVQFNRQHRWLMS